MHLRDLCITLIMVIMKVSISLSVGRAFAVLELFRKAQKPASATQISRSLDAPHSSIVAILKNLRALGFLSFDETNKTYFPTARLRDLTAWLRPPWRDPTRLGGLVEDPRSVCPTPESGGGFSSPVRWH